MTSESDNALRVGSSDLVGQIAGEIVKALAEEQPLPFSVYNMYENRVEQVRESEESRQLRAIKSVLERHWPTRYAPNVKGEPR